MCAGDILVMAVPVISLVSMLISSSGSDVVGFKKLSVMEVHGDGNPARPIDKCLCVAAGWRSCFAACLEVMSFIWVTSLLSRDFGEGRLKLSSSMVSYLFTKYKLTPRCLA